MKSDMTSKKRFYVWLIIVIMIEVLYVDVWFVGAVLNVSFTQPSLLSFLRTLRAHGNDNVTMSIAAVK